MRFHCDFPRAAGAIVCAALLLGHFQPAARAEEPAAAREARQLLRAQKYDEAAAKFAELVKTNRFDGRLWSNYGFSLHSGKRYEEARGPFLKAIELGESPAGNMYNIACGYALLGKTEEAAVWLRKALDAGFVEDETILKDTDMDPIRNDPRFKAAVGFYPPEGFSRDEQWRYDLDFYARRMEQMHWDLYAKVTKETFQGAVQQLKTDVPKLTDDQVLARLRRITASVGDGHTVLRRTRAGEKNVARYPLDLHVFSDGLFVRGAPPELAQWVGGQVLRIGALETAAALEATKPYASVDNPMGYLDWAAGLLVSPAILEAIGAAPDTKGVSFTVRMPAGETVTRTLAPVAFDLSGQGPEARFAVRGYQCANAAATAKLPLYLQKPEKNLWFEYVPERKLVYFYFGHVLDDADETLAQVCERLFEFIKTNPVEHLVIDMRLNGGGNTGLVLPLIHGLIRCDKVNREGGLFVVIGRQTFSAAMNTASLLELHTKATFVGEPTGSSPNFVGESTTFTLPCNKYVVSCSSRYWQHVSSTDKRIWIAPQIVAELSFADYAANRDPALAAIFKVIDERPADVSREKDTAPAAATERP